MYRSNPRLIETVKTPPCIPISSVRTLFKVLYSIKKRCIVLKKGVWRDIIPMIYQNIIDILITDVYSKIQYFVLTDDISSVKTYVDKSINCEKCKAWVLKRENIYRKIDNPIYLTEYHEALKLSIREKRRDIIGYIFQIIYNNYKTSPMGDILPPEDIINFTIAYAMHYGVYDILSLLPKDQYIEKASFYVDLFKDLSKKSQIMDQSYWDKKITGMSYLQPQISNLKGNIYQLMLQVDRLHIDLPEDACGGYPYSIIYTIISREDSLCDSTIICRIMELFNEE